MKIVTLNNPVEVIANIPNKAFENISLKKVEITYKALSFNIAINKRNTPIKIKLNKRLNKI